MCKLKLFSSICMLGVFAMMPQASSAQLNIGLIGGMDLEPKATMVGLAMNMNVMILNVGMHAEFGEATEDPDVCGGTQVLDCKFDVLRFMIPISYPVAMGESGFMLYPFVAPGVYSWSCDLCDGTSEFSVDAGVRAQYNVIMAAASYGFLEKTPDWTFRIGFLFGLGSD